MIIFAVSLAYVLFKSENSILEFGEVAEIKSCIAIHQSFVFFADDKYFRGKKLLCFVLTENYSNSFSFVWQFIVSYAYSLPLGDCITNLDSIGQITSLLSIFAFIQEKNVSIHNRA